MRALGSVGHTPETSPSIILNYEEDRKHERAKYTRESSHQDCRRARRFCIAAAPLIRTRAHDLIILPAHPPQPPHEQHERTRKRAEDAATPAGAVPRRALRPDGVVEPPLQHVIVPVRRGVRGRDACEHARAHGLQELQEVRDLGLFGEDDGGVSRARIWTSTHGVGGAQSRKHSGSGDAPCIMKKFGKPGTVLPRYAVGPPCAS